VTSRCSTRWISTGSTEQTADSIADLLIEARSGLAAQLEAFSANTIEVLRHERSLIIDGVGVPDVDVPLRGRQVLVVAAGYDTETLKCGAEVVVPAYHDGYAPGLERIQDLGIGAVTFPAMSNPEDLALLLAEAQDAALVVTVGFQATLHEFLDRGRSGSAPSTFLTRLKLGSRVVDGRVVAALYGELQFTDAFTDPDRAEQLSELSARLLPAGVRLPSTSDSGTLAGGLLGSVLLDPGVGQPQITRFATQVDRSGAGAVLAGPGRVRRRRWPGRCGALRHRLDLAAVHRRRRQHGGRAGGHGARAGRTGAGSRRPLRNGGQRPGHGAADRELICPLRPRDRSGRSLLP
jgi:hypothetical protein